MLQIPVFYLTTVSFVLITGYLMHLSAKQYSSSALSNNYLINFVESMISRGKLRAIQTPQIFISKNYYRAINQTVWCISRGLIKVLP